MLYQASSLLSIFPHVVIPFLPNCSYHISLSNCPISNNPTQHSNLHWLSKKDLILFTPGVYAQQPLTTPLSVCLLVAAMCISHKYTVTIYIYIYIYTHKEYMYLYIFVYTLYIYIYIYIYMCVCVCVCVCVLSSTESLFHCITTLQCS